MRGLENRHRPENGPIRTASVEEHGWNLKHPLLTIAQQRQLEFFLLASGLDFIKGRDRFIVDGE